MKKISTIMSTCFTRLHASTPRTAVEDILNTIVVAGNAQTCLKFKCAFVRRGLCGS